MRFALIDNNRVEAQPKQQGIFNSHLLFSNRFLRCILCFGNGFTTEFGG